MIWQSHERNNVHDMHIVHYGRFAMQISDIINRKIFDFSTIMNRRFISCRVAIYHAKHFMCGAQSSFVVTQAKKEDWQVFICLKVFSGK